MGRTYPYPYGIGAVPAGGDLRATPDGRRVRVLSDKTRGGKGLSDRPVLYGPLYSIAENATRPQVFTRGVDCGVDGRLFT